MESSHLIRSNIVTWFVPAASSSVPVFTSNQAGAVFVITFLSLVNVSGQSNDAALLQTYNTGTVMHSGYVGAGSYDRFPLTCEIAIVVNDGLFLEVIAGTWHAVASGYWTPGNMLGNQ